MIWKFTYDMKIEELGPNDVRVWYMRGRPLEWSTTIGKGDGHPPDSITCISLARQLSGGQRRIVKEETAAEDAEDKMDI